MIYKYQKFFESIVDSYIFLDIDGVMIPFDRDSKFDYHKFFDMDEKWSQEAISVLNKICDLHKCKVVLITSFIRSKSFSELKNRLKEVGFNGNIVDELKYHYSKGNRFENVSYYVKENDITNYVVIDDKKHDIDKAPEIRPHWCNTRSKDGLKKEDITKIERILNKKTH
jgi:hypothetical protein